MSGPPAVVVDHITKRYRLYHERNQSLKAAVMRGRRARYDDFLALDDVSFDVPEGVTFGLIGENGSGKSTMLKCIAKILRPDGGSIDVRGKLSALLELGAGFHPELSGRENVYLNGAILGLTRKQIDARFDDIVGFAGIEQFIDSPVKNYSSGMYVRLGFAVAINVDPDVLLIDEVLAVGDEEFQRKCTDKISQFRREGRTIIIVSHALPSIRALCDQVALLEHGHLVAVGTPGDVIDTYLTEVLATPQESVSPDGHGHFGTGEIRLHRVEMLDSATGAPRTATPTGSAVTFRLHFEAQRDMAAPVFGIDIYSGDGVHISGTTTRHHGIDIDVPAGPGYVDLEVPRLLLLPDHYHFSASVQDRRLTHVVDQVERIMRFDVVPGDPREDAGVVSLGGTWRARAVVEP